MSSDFKNTTYRRLKSGFPIFLEFPVLPPRDHARIRDGFLDLRFGLVPIAASELVVRVESFGFVRAIPGRELVGWGFWLLWGAGRRAAAAWEGGGEGEGEEREE